MRDTLLCIAGPTASGKTGLAIELALKYGGEVVSCDAMQVYRGMDIGTAKPDMAERRGVPHHMLDVADPSEPYSAALYVEHAEKCIGEIRKRGRLPIVCGGTGLYLEALLAGLHGAGTVPDSPVRLELERRASNGELPELYSELSRTDPDSALRIHANDKRRIIRALEVYLQTGIPLSLHHERSRESGYRDALVLGICFSDRAALYERIEQRVDMMIAAGLEHEARALLSRDPPPCHTAMQAIGYKEFQDNTPVEHAAALIKQSSRRLAKRQITWFARRPHGIRRIEACRTASDPDILAQATQIVEDCGLR